MPAYTAKTADKHKLYEEAVQCVEADIDFVIQTYKKLRGSKPRTLKEDFCGTASAAVEFARRSKKNRAIAIDLEPEVLAYGRKHHLPKLKKRQDAVALMEKNVLEVLPEKADALLAMNFSYNIFKERSELLAYFRAAYAGLNDTGVMMLDAYGGWQSWEPMEEEKECKGFTYVWDQHAVDPITNEVLNYIHFYFPDGTKLKKAFVYDWRLWTLRELTEMLQEAGFAESHVYWEGWDEGEEEGNGVFTRAEHEENCAGWVSYIVALK